MAGKPEKDREAIRIVSEWQRNLPRPKMASAEDTQRLRVYGRNYWFHSEDEEEHF